MDRVSRSSIRDPHVIHGDASGWRLLDMHLHNKKVARSGGGYAAGGRLLVKAANQAGAWTGYATEQNFPQRAQLWLKVLF